jgi:hypothetical protein
LLVWCAPFCNVIVGTITVALIGWTAAGMHAAARNTARFAFLWFLVAFAAPGLSRFFRGLPSEGQLIWAYVAAHLIHFVAVAVLILTFDSAHFTQAPGRSATTVLVGFLIVLSAGVTAKSRLSGMYAALHSFALYAIFVIFFLAFAQNRVGPLRLLTIPLVLALVLRLAGDVLSVRIMKRTHREVS